MTEFFEFIPAIWLSSLTVYQRLETTPTALTVRWKVIEFFFFHQYFNCISVDQFTSDTFSSAILHPA